MKTYIDYILIGMKENLAYPSAVWAKFFSRIIYLYLQFSIWKALFASNSQTNMSLNQNDTLKYVAVATIISTFMECSTIDWLNAQIQTGNIAMDFIRPVNFKGMLFSRHLGDTIVKMIFYCIPLSVVVVMIMGKQLLCPTQFFYGILSVILAYGIQFLYSLIIGLLALWLIVTWPLNMLLGAIYKLLSGVWIPVTMFPDLLYRINLFLPFRAIYAIPVTILTQKMEANDITGALLTQLLWIGILFLFTEIVWFFGKRKLIVQGG
jgi:ABC-type uncharacterized transport system permease subunit